MTRITKHRVYGFDDAPIGDCEGKEKNSTDLRSTFDFCWIFFVVRDDKFLSDLPS